MPEYIDREVLFQALTDKFKARLGSSHIPTWNDAFDTAKSVPVADVVERKKGHYIVNSDGYADGYPVYDIWSCSECGCVFEDWDEKPNYNYCPNCGADMRDSKL